MYKACCPVGSEGLGTTVCHEVRRAQWQRWYISSTELHSYVHTYTTLKCKRV